MSLLTCASCSTRYAVGLSACPNCRSVDLVDGSAVEVPLMAATACTNTECPAAGVQRRVMLPRPAPGVVELPVLLCARCGHVLPLAWPGPDGDGDISPMSPKITRHGGATNKHDRQDAAAADPEPTPAAAAGQPDTEPQTDGLREDPGAGEPMHAVDGDEVTGDGSGRALPPVPDEEYGPDAVPLDEGGEESWPGSSSSTSTGKPSATPGTSKPAPRKRTRAESRSTKARTANSSARPADTSGPETDAPTDDNEA